MLFDYLRAHWMARDHFPLPSRVVSMLRSARALLFRRAHRELYQLGVVRDYVSCAAPGELFRHFCCRHYLVRDLSWSERVACALHHYRFEDLAFGPAYKRLVYLEGGLPLWRTVTSGIEFAIRLVRGVGLQAEGDLSVILLAGGERLHCISFSWVSGQFAAVDAPVVPFLARNQGRGRRDLDVQACFGNAFPQNSANLFCFSAIEGLARAIGVPGMVGVRGKLQACYEPEDQDHFANAYDAFWRSLGATELSQLGWHIPVPVPLKPLNKVAAKHRKRAMIRRQHWAAISEAARMALEPHIVAAHRRGANALAGTSRGSPQIALSSEEGERRERRSAGR